MFIGDPFATGVTLDPDFHLRGFAHGLRKEWRETNESDSRN